MHCRFLWFCLLCSLVLFLSGCGDSDSSVASSADGLSSDTTVDFTDPPCLDRDKDGIYGLSDTCPGGTDCNDTNITVFPGAPEICGDGIDQDCNNEDLACPTDCLDPDGDGWGEGATCKGGDCNNNDPNVYPGAEEICGDGIDQNCDNIDEPCCTAACGDRECGDDGCGGSCGSCEGDTVCDNTTGMCSEPADECGDITFAGCCLGDTVKFCNESGELDQIACAQEGNVCGWKDDAGFYDCGTSTAEDPSGDNDRLCPGETCTPDCDGKICGPDGCGGICGDSECPEGTACEYGQCVEPAVLDSCVGKCGAYIPGATCFCDEGCMEYGDCCPDFCDACSADFPDSCGCEDADGDGYGAGPSCAGLDCDDTNKDIYTGATEVCGDTIDQDCDGVDLECGECDETVDADEDGFFPGEGCASRDCDDSSADINPGAEDVCGDGIDQDCSGQDTECPAVDCIDGDGDGYGEGSECIAPDCNDSDPNVNPAAEEDICGDGIDQDCDNVDPECPSECVDADNDGEFAIAEGCAEGTDCNDLNATIGAEVEEICGDGIDQDCNGADLECPFTGCTTNSDCETGEWCNTLTDECYVPSPAQWWAPVVYLDTNPSKATEDFFTTIDFDGDSVAANNADNMDKFDKRAVVYHSFVSTETHWYIGYHFYFPKRYAGFSYNYENAMRSALLVIRRNDGYGELELIETAGENVRLYVPEDSPLLVSYPYMKTGNIKWDNQDGHNRPVLFVETGDHAISADETWSKNGGQFPGNNGVIYRWGLEGDKSLNIIDELDYEIKPLAGTLWAQRTAIGTTKLFKEFGVLARDESSLLAPESLTPWAYKDGSAPAGRFLYDPATMVRQHFGWGWGTFDTRYEENPYAIRVDINDLSVTATGGFADNEADPYVKLYMYDGRGDEHVVLQDVSNNSTTQNFWKGDNIPEGTLLQMKNELERYWFYGISAPNTPYFGIEVRDADYGPDGWLMDPKETQYYDASNFSIPTNLTSTVKFLDFEKSNMFVRLELED